MRCRRKNILVVIVVFLCFLLMKEGFPQKKDIGIDLGKLKAAGNEIDTAIKLLLHFDGADGDTFTVDPSFLSHGVKFVEEIENNRQRRVIILIKDFCRAVRDVFCRNKRGHSVELDDSEKKWGSSSCYFNGKDGYLTISNSDDCNIVDSNTDSWTIDMWVRFVVHSSEEVLLEFREDSEHLWRLWHLDEDKGNDGFGFLVYNGDTVSALIDTGLGGEAADSDWHHLALCKAGSKYAVYVDGRQVNYTDNNSTVDFTGGNLNIGVKLGLCYFNGHIDELRIQQGNLFSAAPNPERTDTIEIPKSAYN